MDNVKLTEGLIFTGKHFEGTIQIESIDEAANILNVKLTKEVSFWREEFNLEHTKVGFENGEYKLL
jgi:hypothetical protein